MKNFVNNRSYDELIELQGIIEARMESMKSKRKAEKWTKLKEHLIEFCTEYGEIEVENLDGVCIYMGKKSDMHEVGRIIGK